MVFHLIMVIIGLIIMGFAFWAIHYGSGFLKNLGGILTPFGLLITILGALLLAVPGFFSPLKDMTVVFAKSIKFKPWLLK